jgi:hypothetical protein
MAYTDQARNLLALMLDKHGIRTPTVAQHEALKAREKGDADRAAAWIEVAKLAEYALREGPT